MGAPTQGREPQQIDPLSLQRIDSLGLFRLPGQDGTMKPIVAGISLTISDILLLTDALSALAAQGRHDEVYAFIRDHSIFTEGR